NNIVQRPTVLDEHGEFIGVGPPWSIAGCGDFNRDGSADIVWHNADTGETQIWLMNGNNIVQRPTVLDEHGEFIGVGPPWSIAGCGDFNGTFTIEAPSPDEQRIIDRTNQARQNVGGCAPVQLNIGLLRAARGHSQDLADHHPTLLNAPPPANRPKHPGHYGSDDSLGWDEPLLSGGPAVPGRITNAMNSSGFEGENVAAGFPNADAAFDFWFNETPPNDGHRRNILNCNFKLVGVGIAQASDGTRYYTQDFFG
ncbi:CAP domain-containing protein, partial [Kitasatospora sp. NPDC097691]|uniref:CAP domain-containing protein n=1 Tax=Kitasatospora sp. NPDC097691 TaxID=3157231 RepID=UPI003319050E